MVIHVNFYLDGRHTSQHSTFILIDEGLASAVKCDASYDSVILYLRVHRQGRVRVQDIFERIARFPWQLSQLYYPSDDFGLLR
jgi:hypothetical protein